MKRALVLILTASLAVSATVSAAWIPSEFIRGDANRSSSVDISDALAILDYLYAGQSKVDLDCLAAADTNGDDVVDISDPIFILSHLFLGGKRPPAPFPMAGTAPEDAEVGCSTFEIEPPPAPAVPDLPTIPDLPTVPNNIYIWPDIYNGWEPYEPWGTVNNSFGTLNSFSFGF